MRNVGLLLRVVGGGGGIGWTGAACRTWGQCRAVPAVSPLSLAHVCGVSIRQPQGSSLPLPRFLPCADSLAHGDTTLLERLASPGGP